MQKLKTERTSVVGVRQGTRALWREVLQARGRVFCNIGKSQGWLLQQAEPRT